MTAAPGMAIGAAVISLVATQKQINQGSIVDELVRLGRQKGDCFWVATKLMTAAPIAMPINAVCSSLSFMVSLRLSRLGRQKGDGVEDEVFVQAARLVRKGT
jgi:hypothetical protein